MSQPQIIDQIVSDMGLSKANTTPGTTPSFTTNLLVKFQDAENFDQNILCRSFIGKLNYL